jgi:peptide/nickel transport system ATP-binding protein
VSGSDEASIELLESVGVTAAQRRLRSYPHELSGGQRQRIMIAIAIARSPALVVADEPTTALDVTIQVQLLKLIRRLRDETGTAFVLITHDLGVAAEVADRIAVFYAGRVVELGTASEVLRQPAHPYTIGLLRSRITLGTDDARPLPSLAGEAPRPQADLPGCPFEPRCEFAQRRCTLALPALEPVARSTSLARCIRADELEPASIERAVTPPWETPGESREVAMRLASAEKVFRLRGRSARRERLQALRSVDLELQQGECLGIVGESGCGKSTLLRVIAGLLDLDDGSCSLPGGDGRAQMVFQDAAASLTPWLSVGEQIAERLPKRTNKATRSQGVANALAMVGLSPDIAHTKVHHLSGGQCQRVALARAIVVPPDILLCDEPTSSLDVSLAATVLNLIGTLRRTLGMSVIFVTHDLAAARHVADRLAVMYLGRIVEVGPADEVALAPGHPYTKALIAAVPDLGGVRPQAKGELPNPIQPPSGCPYHPRCLEAIPECASVDPPLVPFDDEQRRKGACVHLRS